MCVISNFIKDKIFFEVDNSDKLSIELIYCLEHLAWLRDRNMWLNYRWLWKENNWRNPLQRLGGGVDRLEFFLHTNRQKIPIGQEHCYMSIYCSGFFSREIHRTLNRKHSRQKLGSNVPPTLIIKLPEKSLAILKVFTG